MAGYGRIWQDMVGYGQIWRDTSRYRKRTVHTRAAHTVPHNDLTDTGGPVFAAAAPTPCQCTALRFRSKRVHTGDTGHRVALCVTLALRSGMALGIAARARCSRTPW